MSKRIEKAGTHNNSWIRNEPYRLDDGLSSKCSVYKTSSFMKAMAILGFLLALLMIGVMVNLCINPLEEDNRLSSILATGIIMVFSGAVLLISACAALFGFIELKDNVVLTNHHIKCHLHQQALPPSFKVIDDEVLWKDVKDASLVEKESTTFLVLTLLSGEVKEFGIGHLDKRLQVDIEYSRNPKAYIEMEEELEWLKKKVLKKLPVWLSMELIGAILMVAGQHRGIILAVYALMLGFLSLSKSNNYNSCFSDSLVALFFFVKQVQANGCSTAFRQWSFCA